MTEPHERRGYACEDCGFYIVDDSDDVAGFYEAVDEHERYHHDEPDMKGQMTMSDAVHYSEPNGGSQMVSISEYARIHEVTTRSVNRWLGLGELPGASKDGAGKWWIPVDAVRNASPSPSRQTAVVGTTRVHPSPAELRLPTLATIEDMATFLGTTPIAVRKLAADGHLTIGPYGPRGALRVVISPA